MKRAMIAMSGGVDSSVAAYLMQRAGYDCRGVTMRLYRKSDLGMACHKTCCADPRDGTHPVSAKRARGNGLSASRSPRVRRL